MDPTIITGSMKLDRDCDLFCGANFTPGAINLLQCLIVCFIVERSAPPSIIHHYDYSYLVLVIVCQPQTLVDQFVEMNSVYIGLEGFQLGKTMVVKLKELKECYIQVLFSAIVNNLAYSGTQH